LLDGVFCSLLLVFQSEYFPELSNLLLFFELYV